MFVMTQKTDRTVILFAQLLYVYKHLVDESRITSLKLRPQSSTMLDIAFCGINPIGHNYS